MSAELFTELLDVLDVESSSDDTFVGRTWAHRLPRVFGGQVLSQALVSAGRTVPAGRYPHSLHAYFLRGGDADRPIRFTVTTIRDGNTLSTRRVDAHQDSTQIFTMTTSFAAKHLFEVTALDHQETAAGPRPDPTDLDDLIDRLEPVRATLPGWWNEGQPFDIRFFDHPSALASGSTRPPRQQFWARAGMPSAARHLDPTMQCAVLAFLSDLNLLDPALMPLGRSWYGNGYTEGASVDHAMWFHTPPRMDRWLTAEQLCPVAAGARPLCTSRFFSEDGTLVATANQEGLLRSPGG
ncbi:acyl-CoA thioesterase [Gordonia rhizosphera]|uniref:Putative acyl-CoA thioesterase n=1 Tax=Gordonia rhizosphera NBRC 16068 TaxID=1108045 RepID=K6WSQ3_9ACTN|nr:acyl-CoA thioesterase domain-containing protein [Gordonia rhizosphera]GAB89594.1 putative acyl-CoA thioesterase [Gordonia rhizosphera NBRC 16068]